MCVSSGFYFQLNEESLGRHRAESVLFSRGLAGAAAQPLHRHVCERKASVGECPTGRDQVDGSSWSCLHLEHLLIRCSWVFRYKLKCESRTVYLSLSMTVAPIGLVLSCILLQPPTGNEN